MKKNQEFEAFADLVDKVLKVPHGEIKARLDEEKKAKKRKKMKGRK